MFKVNNRDEWINKTKSLCKIVIRIHPKHFLKCVLILRIEFLYYVLERTQLIPPFYPLSHFISAWLFIIRLYNFWWYHWQKHVRCHLWFDIEWKNEWTCMLDEHVGWHVQTIWIFIQHSSNIYSTFHPTCWIKCWIGLTRPLDNQWQKHLKRNQFIEKVKQSTLSHHIFGIAMVCISFHVKIIKVLVI